jgi:hypothetical protein
MFKAITTVLVASAIAASPATAAPSKKIFSGNYDGITEIENVMGDSVFYSPVRFKITKTGVITGTAKNYQTGKLLTVKGKIGKVTAFFGIRFIGKASGTFSDGTKWTAEVEAMKGVSGKLIRGKARRGAYSGSLSLTNL